MLKKFYTFDDVALAPAFSNVKSRLEPDTTTWITDKIQIKIPLLNAPMDSVINYELAQILLNAGTIPIYHRHYKIEDYVELYIKFQDKIFVSVGINDSDFLKAVIDLGFDKILLDVANGWTRTMLDTISQIRKSSPHVQILAGNVCTSMAYVDLVNAGANGVRVGIGSGAACTTRMVTAVGLPTFSVIQDIYEMSKKYKIPFICDGGIRNSRDISLALAAGASTCMVGKLLALTDESAAEKKEVDEQGVLFNEGYGKKKLARYRGQASKEYQIYNYGSVKQGTVPEGVGFWGEVSGSANELISEFLAGLRSSMSYLGAKNIKEYQQKASFVEVTPSYLTESKPRPN